MQFAGDTLMPCQKSHERDRLHALFTFWVVVTWFRLSELLHRLFRSGLYPVDASLSVVECCFLVLKCWKRLSPIRFFWSLPHLASPSDGSSWRPFLPFAKYLTSQKNRHNMAQPENNLNAIQPKIKRLPCHSTCGSLQLPQNEQKVLKSSSLLF